eukprot:CAMPEP_0182418206 /NCGR_PEP_ID=MMETSP1167-20130531/2689_1 /TAXON_ID=2988 /ORGANISM="Mallomonas Sp, Strain CCMP3275" /LENGTH=218 /DNA_ID=CAMNT_0024592299 /DNA_START=311 /DNA_END=963 /DNA_ORIENTATION=+
MQETLTVETNLTKDDSGYQEKSVKLTVRYRKQDSIVPRTIGDAVAKTVGEAVIGLNKMLTDPRNGTVFDLPLSKDGSILKAKVAVTVVEIQDSESGVYSASSKSDLGKTTSAKSNTTSGKENVITPSTTPAVVSAPSDVETTNQDNVALPSNISTADKSASVQATVKANSEQVKDSVEGVRTAAIPVKLDADKTNEEAKKAAGLKAAEEAKKAAELKA